MNETEIWIWNDSYVGWPCDNAVESHWIENKHWTQWVEIVYDKLGQ